MAFRTAVVLLLMSSASSKCLYLMPKKKRSRVIPLPPIWDLVACYRVKPYYLTKQKKKGRHCTYKYNIETCSRNHCCSAKVITIAYSECVSAALFILHEKRMRCITLSSPGHSGSTIFLHIIS
jgi:hypothetical protein